MKAKEDGLNRKSLFTKSNNSPLQFVYIVHIKIWEAKP